jgi:hypothetical protein
MVNREGCTAAVAAASLAGDRPGAGLDSVQLPSSLLCSFFCELGAGFLLHFRVGTCV